MSVVVFQAFPLFPGFQLPLPSIDIILFVVSAVATVVFVVIIVARGRKYDLYALVIDDLKGAIRLVGFTKVGENLYVGDAWGAPVFLVPGDAASYSLEGFGARGRVLVARAHQIVALPTEPVVAEAFFHGRRVLELGMDGSSRDVASIIKELLRGEERRVGWVRVSPVVRIALAFDTREYAYTYIDHLVVRLSRTLQTIMTHTKSLDRLSKYIESIGLYHQRRFTWLLYISLIIVMIAIAYAIMRAISH